MPSRQTIISAKHTALVWEQHLANHTLLRHFPAPTPSKAGWSGNIGIGDNITHTEKQKEGKEILYLETKHHLMSSSGQPSIV